LIYQLQQLELSEVETGTDEWDDLVKVLPSGDLMTLKQIKRALAGDAFYYFKGEGSPAVHVDGIDRETWSYYFSVFHNTEEFGLPHGRGWLDELPWVVQFLTQMRHTKRLIEMDARSGAMNNNSGDISPAIFTR